MWHLPVSALQPSHEFSLFFFNSCSPPTWLLIINSCGVINSVRWMPTLTSARRCHIHGTRAAVIDISIRLRLTRRPRMVIRWAGSPWCPPAAGSLAIAVACSRGHVFWMRAVSSDMLFHIVLSSKGLVAYGAMHTLLSRVFFAVACGVAGCGESRWTSMAGCERARVFVLFGPFGTGSIFRSANGSRRGWGVRRRVAAQSLLGGCNRGRGISVRVLSARGIVTDCAVLSDVIVGGAIGGTRWRGLHRFRN